MLNDNIAGSLRPVPLSYSGETEAPRGPDRGARSVGLSKLHIPPHSGLRVPSASVPLNGSLVELSGGRVSQAVVTPPAKRGLVRTFSRGSRRRLLKTAASINQKVAGLPLFVTLTYPAMWENDYRRWKRDLEAFWKRVRRRYLGVSAVWKLEPQKRGAPHFHLLVFGAAHIPYAWVARAWYEVVGSGDLKHRRAGTRIERVRSWKGVMYYAAKYLAKVSDPVPGGASSDAATASEPFEYVGRWWGVLSRADLPITVIAAPVTWDSFFTIRRILRAMLRKRGVRLRPSLFAGCSVFCSSEIGFRLLDAYGGL